MLKNEEYELALSMIKNNDDPICKEHLDYLLKRCSDNGITISPVTIIALSKFDNEYYDICVDRLT